MVLTMASILRIIGFVSMGCCWLCFVVLMIKLKQYNDETNEEDKRKEK